MPLKAPRDRADGLKPGVVTPERVAGAHPGVMEPFVQVVLDLQ